MRVTLKTLIIAASLSVSGVAMADNALSTDQLLKATQASLQDYASGEPDMAKSISGFRVSTVGSTAQVIIEMNSDGMHMSAKYLCVPQNAIMACNLQH